ncbi:MAG: hypothetical protein KGL39_11580 [Patescibacteria group bacterium]|nr:hypothetical protein [Patescibacteria group bacterium]
MSNIMTRQEVEAAIKRMSALFKALVNELPLLGNWLGSGVTEAYLCNAIATTGSTLVGGSGYTAPVAICPLPANAPSGSVPVSISLTVTGGVITAATISPGSSGYGTIPPAVQISDSTGTGASLVLAAANPDQVYNFTPQQAGWLQFWIGLDYTQIGAVLMGSVEATTAAAATVASGGTGYVVGDVVVGIQTGLYGFRMTVTAAPGGVVAAVSINIGGIGAAVASGLSTAGGSGTGLTVNITNVAPYNFVQNTRAWAPWTFQGSSVLS